MFEILAAIFGSAHLANKVIGDKIGHYEANRKYNTIQQKRDLIINNGLEEGMKKKLFFVVPPDVRLGDMDLTPEMEEKMLREIIEFRQKTIDSLIPESDLQFVFGDSWKELLTTALGESIVDVPFSSTLFSIWDVILNLLLSELGVVPFRNAYEGYSFGRGIKYIPFEERFDVAHRAFSIIGRNIRNKYPTVSGLNICQKHYGLGAGIDCVWAFTEDV